jgi:hypothetical protein
MFRPRNESVQSLAIFVSGEEASVETVNIGQELLRNKNPQPKRAPMRFENVEATSHSGAFWQTIEQGLVNQCAGKVGTIACEQSAYGRRSSGWDGTFTRRLANLQGVQQRRRGTSLRAALQEIRKYLRIVRSSWSPPVPGRTKCAQRRSHAPFPSPCRSQWNP